MKEQILHYFTKAGYHIRSTNVDEIVCFYQITQSSVQAVIHIDVNVDNKFSYETIASVKEKVISSFTEYNEIHTLILLAGTDYELARLVAKEDRFCWFLDTSMSRLIIFENQVSEFYGLRAQLEDILKKEPVNKVINIKTAGLKRRKVKSSFPIVTTVLIGMNVFIFFICTLTGDILYNKGELFGPYILDQGQVYRFLTAMFLHAGIAHLLNNMLILLAAGQLIEDAFGRLRFSILYLLAGVGGGIASMWYSYESNRMYSSVGASGAIFGLIGALIFLVIANRGAYNGIGITRIIFAVGFSIYLGISSSGVDNAAHIGGLVTGFVLAAILYTLGKSFKKR